MYKRKLLRIHNDFACNRSTWVYVENTVKKHSEDMMYVKMLFLWTEM